MNHLRRFLKKINPFQRRKGAVRYMFTGFTALAALLGAMAITATDVSYVRLEASQATVESGERFRVEIFAYAHVPVNAIDITLEFDESAATVKEVDRGQSVITIWTEDPIIESNKVTLRGGTFRRGFVGEHLIAAIDFEANETGQSALAASDVVFLAGDGEGSTVAVAEANDSTVSLFVYDENTSPESIGVSVSVELVTDLTGDGEVDLQDVSAFMAAWSNKDRVYDFNDDGQMTFRDFSIILSDLFFK